MHRILGYVMCSLRLSGTWRIPSQNTKNMGRVSFYFYFFFVSFGLCVRVVSDIRRVDRSLIPTFGALLSSLSVSGTVCSGTTFLSTQSVFDVTAIIFGCNYISFDFEWEANIFMAIQCNDFNYYISRSQIVLIWEMMTLASRNLLWMVVKRK